MYMAQYNTARLQSEYIYLGLHYFIHYTNIGTFVLKENVPGVFLNHCTIYDVYLRKLTLFHSFRNYHKYFPYGEKRFGYFPYASYII